MSMLSDLLIEVSNKLAEVEAQLGDIPAALEAAKESGRRERDQEFTDMVAAKDLEKSDFGFSEYARGFVDGGNGQGSGDKIYSQVEVDAMLAPLNESVLALQGRIAELEGIVASVDQRIVDAVAAKVAEMNQRIDEMQGAF